MDSWEWMIIYISTFCPKGAFVLNMYNYAWVHQRGINFEFVVQHIHMVHKLKLVGMYMYKDL